MKTLPDYMASGLGIVLVDINHGAYSVKVAHYFAPPRNRFWLAIYRSRLLVEFLGLDTDHLAPRYGIGFTDVVKRPSSSASKLGAVDFRRWAPMLREKLKRFQPLIVCFHGMTAYRSYLKYAKKTDARPRLGLQCRAIGVSRVFVAQKPPSFANAAYSMDDLVSWYGRLKDLLDELRRL